MTPHGRHADDLSPHGDDHSGHAHDHAHDHAHGHAQPALPRNQALVLEALDRAGGPLTAYALLDLLRDDGMRAPLQIYRALEKLMASGRAHRLESINAFVSCRHPGCHAHASTAFMICDTCGKVEEVSDAGLTAQLGALAGASSFALTRSTIELRGLCRQCAA